MTVENERRPDAFGMPRVALVEDDPADAALVRHYLDEAHPFRFEVDWFRSMADFFASNASHDAAIVDLGLPDVQGAQTLEELQYHAPDLPVVVVSHHRDEALALELVSSGAQDFIEKSELEPMLIARSIHYGIRRKRVELKLESLAGRDPLTGLVNRQLFGDRLDQAIARAKRNHSHLGLMFLDLDRFKVVNDTHGHGAGDALLREVGERLSRCLRESDVLARIGGDEFVILAEDAPDADGLGTLAEKIIDALTQPFDLDGVSVSVGTSIGIAEFPDCAPTAEDLVTNADRAMYAAKSAGRGTYRFYDGTFSEGRESSVA